MVPRLEGNALLKAVVAAPDPQMAGHHRGFFFSLGMFACGEVLNPLRIHLIMFLMKTGKGERERERREKE